MSINKCRSEVKIINACFVAYGKAAYKQKGGIQKYHLVYGFPNARPSLEKKFVNCQYWMPKRHSGMYSKHFEENRRISRGWRGWGGGGVRSTMPFFKNWKRVS